MRILTRTLALLAGALVLGGVVAEAASASRDDQVHAFPSIKGAGIDLGSDHRRTLVRDGLLRAGGAGRRGERLVLSDSLAVLARDGG